MNKKTKVQNSKKKLTFPVILPIAGKDYTIKLSTRCNGGHFSCKAQEIVISTHLSKADFMAVLIHEIYEVILTERLYRFAKEKYPLENGDYLFVMNHDQFEKSVNDLAYALSKVIVQ